MKKDFIEVFALIKKNKLLFAISNLVDLSFLGIFLFAYYVIMTEIFAILARIMEITNAVSAMPEQITGQAMAFQALAGNIEFLTLYSSLLRWLMILVVTVYLIWNIFQGVNFSVTSIIVNKKSNFWKYFGKFSLFSLIFYVFVILSFILTIYLSLLNTKIILPVFTQTVINVILIVLLLAIKHYFCISTVMISRNGILVAFVDAFRIGTKKILKIIPLCLVIFVSLSLCVLLLYWFFILNVILFYFGILLIFLPLISSLRILFFNYIDRIK